MTTALLLLALLGALGAFDTLYYYEWLLRLPTRPHARQELLLHASRDFAYALLFSTIGWLTWNGMLAWLFAGLLVAEIVFTLWDFVEEDRTRKLPAGERCMHAIMGIVYGLFLAHLFPELAAWSRLPSAFARADHGAIAWLLTAMGAGVLLSGVRDLASARRHARAPAVA
jgi:hypothetical protein